MMLQLLIRNGRIHERIQKIYPRVVEENKRKQRVEKC